MNKLKVILKNDPHKAILESFSDFKFKYSNCNISYNYENLQIIVTIKSKKSFKELYEMFMLQYELLFINFGYFIPIAEYKENDDISSFSKYNNLEYVYSQERYIKKDQIVSVPNLINNVDLDKFTILKREFSLGMISLYYIKSKRYERVLIDHLFVTLIQICDGYSILKFNKPNKYFELQKTIKPYIDLLNILNNKYSLDIYGRFNANQDKISKNICDTRHQYSHYIRKKDSFRDGEDHILYFWLFDLLLRMIIFNDLGISYEDSAIENIRSICDWSSDIRKLDYPYLSMTYKITESVDKVKKKMNEVSNERN